MNTDKIKTTFDSERVTAAPSGVGDAVGVDRRKWFVAIVNNNTEKSTQQRLDNMGYVSYVAKQDVIRVWKNGRKSKVDKVVIPSLVFIYCTEKERREIVTYPFINRFMTDKAAATLPGGSKPLAVIPQQQIDTLRFMLGQSDVPVVFVETQFKVHDNVTVIRGALSGIKGEVINVEDGKCNVLVSIGIIGTAKVTIDSINLEHTR